VNYLDKYNRWPAGQRLGAFYDLASTFGIVVLAVRNHEFLFRCIQFMGHLVCPNAIPTVTP
jgi:hypothetical protein